MYMFTSLVRKCCTRTSPPSFYKHVKVTIICGGLDIVRDKPVGEGTTGPSKLKYFSLCCCTLQLVYSSVRIIMHDYYNHGGTLCS